MRRSALARAIRADGDVIVDLSDLVHADPSLMLDLAMLARRLRVRHCVLFLRRPQPQIRALIEIVGLHRLPSVRLEGPAPAFA
jgi:anti-anti-sigma regulatory factor